jgi:hypothetical protein
VSKHETNPSRPSLCVLLARGDHVAGFMLDRITHWAQYGKAKVPDTEGTWVANDREWWMREAQLSEGQLDRSLAKLAKFELIEKNQHPFGGRNIMHVRPSELTADILAASKTWGAAAEIFAQAKIPMSKALAKLPAIDPPLVKMLEAWGAEVTAQDIGKLAVFRQDIKAVSFAGNTYDFTGNVLHLITWVKANWAEIGPKGSKPSLALFCDSLYGKALTATMKEVEPSLFAFDPP